MLKWDTHKMTVRKLFLLNCKSVRTFWLHKDILERSLGCFYLRSSITFKHILKSLLKFIFWKKCFCTCFSTSWNGCNFYIKIYEPTFPIAKAHFFQQISLVMRDPSIFQETYGSVQYQVIEMRRDNLHEMLKH